MSELTYKQKKFVENYKGNGTQAARLAGYEGSDNVLAQIASDNLRKAQILKAIEERDCAQLATVTANKHARFRFWTEVMCDEKQSLKDRLRASELLAKAEGDFTDHKIENSRFTLEHYILEAQKIPRDKIPLED